jgi:SecD/SecF fusion protein
MFRRNLWKLTLSVAILLWAVYTLSPIKDRDFETYLRSVVGAKQSDFTALMAKVDDRIAAAKASGKTISAYSVLKQMGREENIDLSQFFPQLRIEETLKNVEKRDNLVLDELLKRSKGRVQLGLDLFGGVGLTLEADPSTLAKQNAVDQRGKLAKAIEIIGNRINGDGVAEPVIRAVGDNRIEVQLPGVSLRDNPDLIVNLVKPARLEFRLVYQGSSAMDQPPANVPPGYEVLSADRDDPHTGRSVEEFYLVKSIPEMSGENVKDAIATTDQLTGGYQVHLNFNSVGAKQFADVTTANAGRLLGIVLDGRLYSAPRINEPITGGSAQITGHFSARDAQDLANALRNPLDVELKVKEQYEVGPTLAADAVSSGIKASILGIALVCGFMITYYTVGGLVSVVTLAVNVLVVLGVMANFGATLTLPGLAGIVLTIGMAVDANILIFERMREELALGKSLSAAHAAGYDKAFVTILDAHITQLLICAVMIWLGTGPIKGFGVTLAIGVFSTLFSVLITGHLILDFLIEGGVLRKFPMLHVFSKPNVDWVKIGKPAFMLSWSIVLIGLIFLFVRSDKALGIDFTGGDQVSISYNHQVDTSQIRSAATAAGVNDINPSYQSALGGGQALLKVELPYGQTDKFVDVIQKRFPEAGFVKVGVNAIGPTIGREIEGNAALSVGLSLLAILVYIAFRFEFGFGMGAVVATVHDVLMTIGMFVLFGGQFNAPMVAAILAIIGYSVNDTVVVFDRIREELKLNPTGDLRNIVNLAITRVFSRSLMTSFTVFLAALALFILGGGVLRELAFVFLIGIITGTFSSICIAAQVFYWWHKGDRKHVEAHQDIAPKYEWAGSSRASK